MAARGYEFCLQMYGMATPSPLLIRYFSQPPSVNMRLCKHGKSALLFLKNNSQNYARIRVHILSSKHSYRPMSVRVVTQLFYNACY